MMISKTIYALCAAAVAFSGGTVDATTEAAETFGWLLPKSQNTDGGYGGASAGTDGYEGAHLAVSRLVLVATALRAWVSTQMLVSVHIITVMPTPVPVSMSYPIYHIPNHEPTLSGGHPSNIVFLTCDAYGVLPPVSKLSDDHAIYPFLSGYTAKVTGTERGVTEPTDTFGAAFLPLHPTKYADLLQKKLQKHNTSVYLVNTDWTSGGYGVGKRMSIKDTRACIDAILDGSIKNSKLSEDPNFGFSVPKKLGEISENVLNTSEAWSEKEAYDVTAKKLAGMFQENFKKYVSTGVTDYSKFVPKL
ncbi:hypothetical protein PInf_004047 [Phytophthora infestans]|nr:hypothetical protein PInf_004047 [Phytophthora infestans]